MPHMTFSEALAELKRGERLRRDTWGRSEWVALKPSATGKGTSLSLPYLYMRMSEGYIVPWMPSQIDILAEDWEIASSHKNPQLSLYNIHSYSNT